MDIAKDLSHQHDLQNSSFFVVTRSQTHGRGRMGRVWNQATLEPEVKLRDDKSPNHIGAQYTDCTLVGVYTPTFVDVYRTDFLPFTFALATHELRVPLEWVSMLVGVCLYDAFLTIYQSLVKEVRTTRFISKNQWNLFLKWPNDVIWNENGNIEKLAGILCEAQTIYSSSFPMSIGAANAQHAPHRNISHVYIGIGINFFHSPNLPQTASFFDKITDSGHKATQQGCCSFIADGDKQSILQKMAYLIEYNLKKYLCKSRTNAQIKSLIIKRSVPIGTVLSVNHKSITGRFCGLNEHGALRLMPAGGMQIETIYSAENIDIMNTSKNIVCIDFGNTRIHITAQNSKSRSIHTDVLYEDLQSNKCHQSIAKIIKIFDFDFIKKIEIFYVSVNSKTITQQSLRKIKGDLQNALKGKKWTINEVTEKDIFKHFTITKTFDHKTLGADRALKCVYAYEKSQQIKKNVLIFSFGTATTCEGFSKEGMMIENFVFPGAQMSFDALHHFTALLPKLNAKNSKFIKIPKYWTQKIYMQRGVLLSVVSTILTTAKLHAPCHVILTGGNAFEIKNTLMQIEGREICDSYEIEILQNIETIVLAKFYSEIDPAIKSRDDILVKSRDDILVKSRDNIPVKSRDNIPVKSRDNIPVKSRDHTSALRKLA